MSVAYILSQLSRKMGVDSTDTNIRPVLIAYLNEAARELYDQSDMQGSLMEQTFKINGDQTISLPSYVGTVRAIRALDSYVPMHINQLRPRYNDFNWKDAWRNVRLKNRQALMATVTNQSVGVITVAMVENPPIVVSVSGPTSTATLAQETVTMDALSKQTVNEYTDYTCVRKNRINQCDVTLSDVDGKVLTIIPNNEIEAIYQILDISSFPYLSVSQSTLDNYFEVLYKKKLPVMFNDNDAFPASGYDDIIVNKVMQLWNEEQDKSELAAGYDAKATRSLARKHEEQNRETEDMISLVAHPHDTIHGRIYPGTRRPYWRYRLWAP